MNRTNTATVLPDKEETKTPLALVEPSQEGPVNQASSESAEVQAAAPREITIRFDSLGVGMLDHFSLIRAFRDKVRMRIEYFQSEIGGGLSIEEAIDAATKKIDDQKATELYFYCDGHVRVYHGDQTALPRHYVARERLCLRATTDYWINAMDGQPFLYVNKEVDPGLIATLTQDVIPWLEVNVAKTPEQELRLAKILGPTGSPWCSTGKATVRSCSRKWRTSGLPF